MPLIKLVVLGAPGCGKTSIIRQFVNHEFDHNYKATTGKQLYFPTIIMDEQLYELQIIDLPPITFIPRNSYEEWNHFRGYGVRNAQAYLLVFDISSSQSFQFIKSLRDQLCAIKQDPVIVIAGNKQDLLTEEHQRTLLNGNNNYSNANGHCTAVTENGHSTGNAHHHHKNGGMHHSGEGRLSSSDLNKEFATIARKQWKCSYVECSAKFNWRVTTLFSALVKAIDRSDDIHTKKQGTSHSQGQNGRRKCNIL